MNPRPAGFIASRRGFLLAASAGILSTQLPGRAMAAEGDGKTLRFGLSVFPPSLSPWVSSGAAAGTVKTLTMRGLLGYDTRGNLVGELAETWSAIDAQTFEFTLRSNAFFSNGSPVRSADVEWSFQQIAAPESAANLKASLKLIEKFEIIDDKRFRLKLSKPFAILPYSLAVVDAPILAIGSTEKAPIACGPFRIVTQERGVFLQLERNETYYKKDAPKLQFIRVIAYADESLRMAALEAGDVDIIEYVPWAAFTRFDKNDRLKLAKSLGPYMLVQFNTTRPPFDNPSVRQAIGFAIRREDIVKTAFAGQGAPLFSFPNPPGSPFKTESEANSWTFDPQKAKAMLAKAGHPNGFNCTLLATSTYGMLQDTALVVASYLQAIGINAELKLPEWASRIKASNEGEYHIAIHGTVGEYNDPDSLYPLLHSSVKSYQTSFGFKSQRIDGLLERGRSELDSNKRAEIYKELAQAYFDEAPQVPLAWRVQAYGLTKNVEGFVNLPGFLTVTSARIMDEVTLS